MKEIKIRNLKVNSKDKKYSLVICEKPNVANRIAIALGTSEIKKMGT